jgi:hypothetical protein
MIVTNKNFRIKKNTNTKSCYRINSLSMKHVDAPKSISVWVCPWIVVEVVARVTCWHVFSNKHHLCGLVLHNTNIDCLHIDIILFCEWFESCFVNLHGVIIGCKHHMFRLQHGWRELPQCWWRFPMFLLSTFKKSMITTHSLCDYLTQGHGIRHGQHKVHHISTKSKLKLVHEHNLVPWNVTC